MALGRAAGDCALIVAEHGTRNTYRSGCRCLPCKAANARYWSWWHQRRQAGHCPLGARIPAKVAQRRVAALLLERYRKAQLARLLGLRRFRPELHPEVITVRTHLKIQRLHRLLLSEAAPDEHFKQSDG